MEPLKLWAELKRRVHKRGPRTVEDLERFCKEEWSRIPFSVFCNLIRCYNNCGRLSFMKSLIKK